MTDAIDRLDYQILAKAVELCTSQAEVRGLDILPHITICKSATNEPFTPLEISKRFEYLQGKGYIKLDDGANLEQRINAGKGQFHLKVTASGQDAHRSGPERFKDGPHQLGNTNNFHAPVSATNFATGAGATQSAALAGALVSSEAQKAGQSHLQQRVKSIGVNAYGTSEFLMQKCRKLDEKDRSRDKYGTTAMAVVGGLTGISWFAAPDHFQLLVDTVAFVGVSLSGLSGWSLAQWRPKIDQYNDLYQANCRLYHSAMSILQKPSILEVEVHALERQAHELHDRARVILEPTPLEAVTGFRAGANIFQASCGVCDRIPTSRPLPPNYSPNDESFCKQCGEPKAVQKIS